MTIPRPALTTTANLRRLVFVLCCMFAGHVWAAGDSCAVDPAVGANIETLRSVFDFLMTPLTESENAINTAASEMAGRVVPFALKFGSIVVLTYLLWNIILWMADGAGSFIELTVEVCVPAAIATAVIKSYSTLIAGFTGIFSELGSAVTGGGSVSTALAKFSASIFGAIATAFKMVIAPFYCIGPFDLKIGLFLFGLVALIIMNVCLILAILALAEIVGTFLVGIILVGIGKGLGPAFIICGATRWTSGFMNSWIKFLASAAMFKVLISTVLMLMSGVLTSVETISRKYSIGDTETFFPLGPLLGLALMLWITKHIFTWVPSIASSLMGGGIQRAVSTNGAAEKLVKTATGGGTSGGGSGGSGGGGGGGRGGGGGSGGGGSGGRGARS